MSWVVNDVHLLLCHDYYVSCHRCSPSIYTRHYQTTPRDIFCPHLRRLVPARISLWILVLTRNEIGRFAVLAIIAAVGVRLSPIVLMIDMMSLDVVRAGTAPFVVISRVLYTYLVFYYGGGRTSSEGTLANIPIRGHWSIVKSWRRCRVCVGIHTTMIWLWNTHVNSAVS